MGGGRSSSGGGGGGNTRPPLEAFSLISQREGKQQEVDDTLNVLRDVYDQYGVQIDTVVGVFPPRSRVMGFYDPNTGEVGMNKSYFDSKKLDDTYDKCVQANYHPPRGNKTGMEAVVSHEAGHKLNYIAGERSGKTAEQVALDVVKKASKKTGHNSISSLKSKISGYAKENNKECVAEAFADVFCNGKKARKESIAVVNELNSYFPNRRR